MKPYTTTTKTGALGDEFDNVARKMLSQDGKLTYRQIGELALRFDVQPRVVFERLEQTCVAPTGAYEHMVFRGMTSYRLMMSVTGEAP